MQKTMETLASFWPAIALVILIFSTMLEPTRVYIEHQDIYSYLIRWGVIVLPTGLFYFLAERKT